MPARQAGPVGTVDVPLDRETLVLTRSSPPRFECDPIPLVPLPSPAVNQDDNFKKKYRLGPEVYAELGLAGQIARKFIALPYRGGKIKGSGQLEGGGLVCTSFAKVFGAFWFSGGAKDQLPLVSREARVRPRKEGEAGQAFKVVAKGKGDNEEVILGETDTQWEADASVRDRNQAANKISPVTGKKGIGLPPGLVYADKNAGARRFNPARLPLAELLPQLKHDRLYAMTTYAKEIGANPKHVWFLMWRRKRGYWITIQSTGDVDDETGRKAGSGPGIYRLSLRRIPPHKRYQAWDWGPSYRKENEDLKNWEFHR